ncbi:uncharacterized protein LOC131631620 [Vicia villosa]|uniref:uncharacterized protein LOC131631620 n=1 Tax=Vicia villosa TaxID=3911 RepID=UPI00273C8353|nr:uncharacterized protein LOC131631620 [Vicia villosa]
MKVLSWNCRGLGSPRAVRALLRLTRLENPDVLFIMESRLKQEEAQSIKYRCGFDSGISVDCRGEGRSRAGGLILLWRNIIQLKIMSYSANHIGGAIVDVVDNQDWFFHGVYGYPEETNKQHTWQLIQDLITRSGDRVIIFGDLNDTLYEHEKAGGNPRSSAQLSMGRQTMDICGLSDLGFQGHPYTWTNGRQGDNNIQCRLDRAIASQSFLNRFSPHKVSHLPRFGSDHAVLKIELEVDLGSKGRRRVHLFRFEEAWSKDKKCEDSVREVWNSAPGSGVSKIAGLQRIEDHFKEYRISGLKKELRRIEDLLNNDSNWDGSEEA